jgi:hypothetical protein
MELERRLHERNQVGVRGDVQTLELGNRVGESQIAQVDRDQPDCFRHDDVVEVSKIEPFEIDHPFVEAEPADQLSDTDVDRVDATGAPVQQRGGEPACARADIDGDAFDDSDCQRVERIRELDVAFETTIR